jgi:hypothetical protein
MLLGMILLNAIMNKQNLLIIFLNKLHNIMSLVIEIAKLVIIKEMTIEIIVHHAKIIIYLGQMK